MTEQEKRQRAIRGLECLAKQHGIVGVCEPENCPYGDLHTCANEIARDAIALLKAQEPRVIPFNEIDNYEVLWLEVRDVETEDGLAPWVKTASRRWFSLLLCSEARPDMILSTPREYGRICRCWTSRPTDEQREATPWET